jgi:hypothetical protein
MRRITLALAAALLFAAAGTSIGRAQSSPDPVPTPIPVPSMQPAPHINPLIQSGIDFVSAIIARNRANAANNASGTVTYFRRFEMQVQCGANCYRNVRLHQGTVINPRGATPGNGTYVDVNGVADSDGTIEANTITVEH